MPRHLVFWMIDADGDTPTDSARTALATQRTPDSSATVFDVLDKDTGVVTRVDLGSPDDEPSEFQHDDRFSQLCTLIANLEV